MNRIKKGIAILMLATVAGLGLTACTPSSYTDRATEQEQYTLENSLEQANLKKRLELQNNPNQIGYVYVMSFAQVIGYYVIQGKVSSSGWQLAPEQEILCKTSSSESCNSLDSNQDDGTYGSGDPGIFFFLADGTYTETTLDYIYSTQPIPIDVPRFG